MTLIRPRLTSSAVAVSVYASPLVEALMAFWSNAAESDSLESFEYHDDIVDLVRSAQIAPDDHAWMDRNDALRWCGLVPFAHQAEATTFDELADYLESLDPDAVIDALVEFQDHDCTDGECDHGELAVGEATDEVSRIVKILRSIGPGMDDCIGAMAPQTEHERQLTTFLARRLETDALVESVTRGIAYRFHADVTDAVLIPSRIMRPWNLVVTTGSICYFIYPMSDEAVDADADAPPACMIDTYKALGDERRLRLLRRLSQGPATLGELAELLDLAKSTTHHHVRLLRAAQLVRAEMQSDAKEAATYQLRPGALLDAQHFMNEYFELNRSDP